VLATLAHAAIGLGFFGIGFLPTLAISGVIWLISHRSPHVAVHAEQAGIYQLIVLVVNVLVIVGWLVAAVALFGAGWPGEAVALLVGRGSADGSAMERVAAPVAVALWLLVVPLFAAWYVGTILLGLVAAARVALGYPFWYPGIGTWVRRKHAARLAGW
jgi:hypothetical protein